MAGLIIDSELLAFFVSQLRTVASGLIILIGRGTKVCAAEVLRHAVHEVIRCMGCRFSALTIIGAFENDFEVLLAESVKLRNYFLDSLETFVRIDSQLRRFLVMAVHVKNVLRKVVARAVAKC